MDRAAGKAGGQRRGRPEGRGGTQAEGRSLARRALRLAGGSRLGYEGKKDSETIGLLRKPSIETWDEYTCLNSLREVEPTSLLILDDHNLDDEADFQRAAPDQGDDEE